LQSLIDDALAKGNTGVALALIMQATGADYATAQKMLEGMGGAQTSGLNPTKPFGPDPNGALPIFGSQILPGGTTKPTVFTPDPNKTRYQNLTDYYVMLGMPLKDAQLRAAKETGLSF